MKFLDKQQIYKVYLENRSKMTEQKSCTYKYWVKKSLQQSPK